MILLYPVILAGGAGSRLWPVSDKQTPKQFLKLFGRRSLFQNTLLRLDGFGESSRFRTVCNISHRARIEAELDGLELPKENHVIAEPVGRNTAPAIYLGARVLLDQDPNAILVVLPADHHVADVPAFQDVLHQAVKAAEDGGIVTLGIQPTSPETGYGYIETSNNETVCPVARFVEKPDVDTAVDYLASGRFLWNSGIFVFRASVMCEEFRQHQPEIVKAVDAFLAGDEEAYAQAPNISVDYAIMEHTSKAFVVRARFGWSDVGSWAAVYDHGEKDENGNVVNGNVFTKATRNSLVRGDRRRVAVLGLEDVLVVETRGSVLVCHKDLAQEVGKVGSTPPDDEAWGYTEHRPWGSFTILGSSENFKTKRLDVLPGMRLSLQSHKHRKEYWIVVKGLARVTRDDQILDLGPGETVDIPVGAKHRVENPGTETLTFIEVQLGSYFGEDDIVRYQDDFNRA